jgi:Phosphorylase superfamily
MTAMMILVPSGAEFRSVQQGLRHLPVNSSIQVLAIPAGGAVRDFLQHQNWSGIKQVVVMGLCGGLVDGVKVGQVGWYGSCQLATGRSAPQPPILGEPEREKYFMSPQNWGLGGLIQWKAVTTEQVISSEMEKRSLHATTGCDVVDMETFWMVEFMQQRGMSVMGLRVVSDGVRGDLPDLAQAFDSNGVLQPWALGRSFVRKPVAALRLVWGSIVALRKLEDCAAMLSESFTI